MLEEVPETEWPPEVRAVMERVRLRNREPGRLYRTLANAPASFDSWVTFASSIREDMLLPRALRELVILRVGQLVGATYEERHHAVMARDHGVTDEQLKQLWQWRTAPVFDARERASLDLCEELVERNEVLDDTWAACLGVMTSQEAVELVLTIGFYCMVCKVLAAFRIT